MDGKCQVCSLSSSRNAVTAADSEDGQILWRVSKHYGIALGA